MDFFTIGLRGYTILLISTLSFVAGSNTDCNGKAFHCVNSTHFKICVDLGGGVSTTVDDFLIPCPRSTVCKQNNLFECEYELTTTLPPVTIQSEVTNEQFQTSDNYVREQLDITTIFPTKRIQGMELTEKYVNKVNETPTSFTAKILTDALMVSMATSNTNDLHTSDINKTSSISQSIDNESILSTTESVISVTQTSPSNSNILVSDFGVSSNYNIEIPAFNSNIQDTTNIDSLNRESWDSLYQNNLDLDSRLTMIKTTDQTSSNPFLSENTSQASIITGLIKSDIVSHPSDLDVLIKSNKSHYNTSERNIKYNKINNTIYSINKSPGINTSESQLNILSSNVSNIYKKSKVNNVITSEPLREHLTDATTASINKVVPETINEFGFPTSKNTTDAIESSLNSKTNMATNMQKIGVTDGYHIKITTSSIPETTGIKANEMSSQIIRSESSYDVDSDAIIKQSLDKNTTPQTSDKKFSTQLNSVNITQYLTTTHPFLLHDKSNITIPLESKSEITTPINISEFFTLSTKEAIQVHNVSKTDNMYTLESVSNNTYLTTNGSHPNVSFNDIVSLKTPDEHKNPSSITHPKIFQLSTVTTESATNDKHTVGDYNFKNVNTLPYETQTLRTNLIDKPISKINPKKYLTTTSFPLNIISYITAVPETTIPDKTNLLSADNITTFKIKMGDKKSFAKESQVNQNRTWREPVMVTFNSDLANTNSVITSYSTVTPKLSKTVTILKPITDVTIRNATWTGPLMVSVTTDLYKNNMTTSKKDKNTTEEISNSVVSLKPISDLVKKNVTRNRPIMVKVSTDLNKNIIKSTEADINITTKISRGVLSLEPLSNTIIKNETWPEPFMVPVAPDAHTNNVTTKDKGNITPSEMTNIATNLEQMSDLTIKNVTWPKLFMVTAAPDHHRNNVTTKDNIIPPEMTKTATSLELISDLIIKNETWPEPFIVAEAPDFYRNNVTTRDSITPPEMSKNVTSLEPISNLIIKNETWPEPFMVAEAPDFYRNNVTTRDSITPPEMTNITPPEMSKSVTSLEPISDFIIKNGTWPEPSMVAVAPDSYRNNVTTRDSITPPEMSNITPPEMSKSVTSLEPISDFIIKNGTWPEPSMVAVAPDFYRNNVTTRDSITPPEMSKNVTSLEPISNLIIKNETWPEPFMVAEAPDFYRNNVTTRDSITPPEMTNITPPEMSKSVTSLEPISDFIIKNGTWPEPSMVAVAPDFYRNNVTTRDSITPPEMSKNVTSLEPISNLIIKNETWPEPFMVAEAPDFYRNNVTTRDSITPPEMTNITPPEMSKSVTSLEPISDFIIKNGTWPEPSMVAVAPDSYRNNVTTRDNITRPEMTDIASTEMTNIAPAEMTNIASTEKTKSATSLEPISDLIIKNGTWPEPSMVAVAPDSYRNNVTTSDNITRPEMTDIASTEMTNIAPAEMTNIASTEKTKSATSLEPISDLIIKNGTWSEPSMVAVAPDSYRNNVTTGDNITPPEMTNITPPEMTNIAPPEMTNIAPAEMTKSATSLEPISDLIIKNETWPEPSMVAVAPDSYRNNVTTRDNITPPETTNIASTEKTKSATSLEPISDLIIKNGTWPEPSMVTVAPDFYRNNVTTRDSITRPEMTDIASTEMTNIAPAEMTNIASTEKTKSATSLEPISDLIIKNGTWPEPSMVTVAPDFYRNNVTTRDSITPPEMTNITPPEMSKSVTSLEPISDLIIKNETWPEPFMVAVAPDSYRNNVTTKDNITPPEMTGIALPEISNNATSLEPISYFITKNETWPKPLMVTAAPDGYKNNITTEKDSNITLEMYNSVKSLKPIGDLIPTNEKVLTSSSKILTSHQSINNSTVTLKSPTKYSENIVKTNNFDTIDSVTSSTESVKTDQSIITPSVITSVPTTLDKPTLLQYKSLGDLDNNVTHKNNTTEPLNYFFERYSSFNSTVMTATEIDTSFVTVKMKSVKTDTPVFESANSDVKNKPITFIDVLSEYNVGSDNYKSKESSSKLQSTITANSSIYFDSTNTNIKHIISLETKTETTMLSDSGNDIINEKQVNYKNGSHNVQTVGKTISGISNLTDLQTEKIFIPKLLTIKNFNLSAPWSAHIIDQNNNSVIDIVEKHNQESNNLAKNPLTSDVITAELNYTDRNVASSVPSNSKSRPIIYLTGTLTPLIENITLIHLFEKSTLPNKQHVTDYKLTNLPNNNSLVPEHNVSYIEHNDNNTEYLYVFKQATTAKELNDTILKELSYNFSKPLTTAKNQENKTSTSADVNIYTSHPETGSNFHLRVISKGQPPENAIKPLLDEKNGNLRSITEHEFKEYVSDNKSESKLSNNSNIYFITSSIKVSEDTTTNWRVTNKMLVANGTKPKILGNDKNVSNDKSWTVTRTKENFTNEFNATSESSTIANSLLIKYSRTDSIKNTTYHADVLPDRGIGFHGIPSEVHNSSISNGIVKLENSHGPSEFLLPIVKTNRSYTQTNEGFSCTQRGKYPNNNDCNKFYICIGRVEPIIGICPKDTVFSEFLKLCTKNVTHCIRNNQFQCTAAGRFNNILSNKTYFICAKKKIGFIRYTLQCQKGYYLDKNHIKCFPEIINVSLSDENSSKITNEFDKSKEIERDSVKSQNYFECEKEGKFRDPQDCRKYYVCKKGRKSSFRRKIKKCDSDEVFHRKKNKCVDEESYECDI